jgi:hypothetical protein
MKAVCSNGTRVPFAWGEPNTHKKQNAEYPGGSRRFEYNNLSYYALRRRANTPRPVRAVPSITKVDGSGTAESS